MSHLREEVKIWNTPIIGAYLIWNFSQGYINGHPTGDAPIGLLHFIAIPILTNKELSNSINNKRSNLQSYARSFEDSKNIDLLLSIQDRALNKLEYTLKSLEIAIAEGLISWDIETGKTYPKTLTINPSRGKSLNMVTKKEGNKAEILGKWFSQHDLNSISTYLKVVF